MSTSPTSHSTTRRGLLRLGSGLALAALAAPLAGPAAVAQTPTPTPTPTATATAVAPALRVSAGASRRDPLGALWFCGMVENPGREALLDPQITIGLLDGVGATLSEAFGTTLNRLVPPGSKTPFAIMVATPPDGWKRETYAVTAPAPDPALLTAVAGDFRLSDAKVADGPWGKQLVGEVRNGLAEPVTGVQIAAAVYRRDGRVEYATLVGLAVDPLAPGATAAFAIDLLGLPGDFQPDRFDLFPEGWRLVG